MSEVIIRVEGIGKKYRIRHERVERYTALRDVIAAKVRGMFIRSEAGTGGVSNLDNSTDTSTAPGKDITETKANFSSVSMVSDAPSIEDFWALRDVSFEVKRGEVVGIIGRNGAGKSTLLKILSRITDPTEGRVELDGRVASLLEVGTGFHPELTGRENIFLNGAVLGMTRAEIRGKFDEIVEFAEVEKFLDTPVKRYSSGMYVRLAFSVAAHLEPEILVVDEVLAVGDAAFQKKCLGKMEDVSKGGRTVLFVSHNMASIATLTTKVLLLDTGKVAFQGGTVEGIQKYIHNGDEPLGLYVAPESKKKQRLLRLEIVSLGASGVHVSGSPFRIRAAFRSSGPAVRGCFSVQIVNESLNPVLYLRAYDHGVFFGQAAGETILECEVPQCDLNVGKYTLHVYMHEPPGGEFFEEHQAICPFDVEIHDKVALFNWRSHVCSYIVPEVWRRIEKFQE